MRMLLSEDEATDLAHDYIQLGAPEIRFSADERRAQVLVDELGSDEGRDYVYHLCGADCYQEWQAENASG